MQALERSLVNNDWITLVLIACLVFIAVARIAYESRFLDFAELPVNEKFLLKASKGVRFEHPFNLLLFTVQFLSISLFIFLIVSKFDAFTEVDPELVFVRITLIYVVFVALKFFIERILGVLFKGESYLNTYQYCKLSYRNYFALLLIPINALFIYAFKPSLLVFQIIVILFLILNVISLFNTFRKYEKLIYNNLFYFILYLCALEIAPYFILFKLFSEVVR